jgi:hypothetical protein
MRGLVAGILFLTGLLVGVYWWGQLNGKPWVADGKMAAAPDTVTANEDVHAYPSAGWRKTAEAEPAGPDTDGYRELATQLVQEDPLIGVVYFEDCLRRGASEEARRFLRAFSFQWAGVDPEALADWIRELPMSYQNEAMTGLISGAARDHPREVGDWILSLEDGPRKTRAVQLYGQFMTDAKAGGYLVDWAWELVSGSEDPATYLGIVAPLIAGADPGWMYAFAGDLPDSATRDQCIHSVVTALARERPLETLDWSQSFAAEPGLRNELEDICLQVLGETSPEQAARWILDTGDSPLLEARVVRLFGYWAESDPAAARTFLRDAPIDPEMKAYLMRIHP